MPQIITPPNGTEMNGILDMFTYVNNTATQGLFMPMILGIIWVIIFMATKGYSNSRALTFASFICFILSVPLAVINVLAPKYCYIALILAGIGAVWIKLER